MVTVDTKPPSCANVGAPYRVCVGGGGGWWTADDVRSCTDPFESLFHDSTPICRTSIYLLAQLTVNRSTNSLPYS